ncbi:MAG: c-type cytochrome [Candidatus Methylomirabilales bacterium]
MPWRAWPLLGLFGLVILMITSPGAAAEPGDLQVGEDVYKEICFACHGMKGDGKGPGAPNFKPRPQVFANLGYMARMDPQYMFWVVKYGKLKVLQKQIPGFPLGEPRNVVDMPAFGHVLEDEEIRRLIQSEHLRAQGKPIPEDIREIYDGACATCHGPHGKGNGERAVSQPAPDRFVSEIQPPPADYTNAKLMERFSDDFRFTLIKKGRLAATEEAGYTTMPPFGEELSDHEIWSAIRYIRETFVHRKAPKAEGSPGTVRQSAR